MAASLLVEEFCVPGENHRPTASHSDRQSIPSAYRKTVLYTDRQYITRFYKKTGLYTDRQYIPSSYVYFVINV